MTANGNFLGNAAASQYTPYIAAGGGLGPDAGAIAGAGYVPPAPSGMTPALIAGFNDVFLGDAWLRPEHRYGLIQHQRAFNTAPVSGPSSLVPVGLEDTSSVVGEELTTPALSTDFWMPNDSDLQAASAVPGDPTAWITRSARLNTVLGATDQTSAWIELGDYAGVFGTAAANQQWNGHYFAWHAADGPYGEMTAGEDFPTGWHEFHIGASTPGWVILIDDNELGYVRTPVIR